MFRHAAVSPTDEVFFHFQASWNNLSKFPKYLLAAIELSVAIATLKEAAMCLEKPVEFVQNLFEARENFTAHDLREKAESILLSHVDAINASMNERDTKITESQRYDPKSWMQITEEMGKQDTLEGQLTAVCENAGFNRIIQTGDILVTKPQTSQDVPTNQGYAAARGPPCGPTQCTSSIQYSTSTKKSDLFLKCRSATFKACPPSPCVCKSPFE